jgi:hypothetical protein
MCYTCAVSRECSRRTKRVTEKREFPNFWEVFSEAQRLSAKRLGVRAYLPWLLTLLIALASTSAITVEIFVQPKVTTTDSIAALSAMIVVGGLLIAVSVACMTQIYITVSDGQFGDYLRTEKAFDQFLTLLMQIVLVVVSVAAVFACLLMDESFVHLLSIAVITGLLVYVTTKTWNLVEALRLLAWHRQEYESLRIQVRLLQQTRATTSDPITAKFR